MTTQTTYQLYHGVGLPGFRADMSEFDTSTRTATATILMGAPVQRSGDRGCAPFAAGGEYIGVAEGKHKFTGSIGSSYEQYDNVPVANEGVFFATADSAIAVGAALNYNTATSRYTTAAVSATVLAVPNSEAETSASAVGVIFKMRLRRVPA